MDLYNYEIPILNTFNSAELSNEFGLKTRFLRFGNDPEGIHHTMAMEVPLRNFTFETNEEAKQYRTHFSLLTLVKDTDGNIVHKSSQDYPLQGPLDKLDGMLNGNILLLRNSHLPPGTYTVESAARDNTSAITSALRTQLTVPAWPKGPALSSVLLIDRVDPVTDEAKEQDNPLKYQSMKIAPNLGKPITPDPNSQIGFYCVLYPSKEIQADPVLAMLFFKDGQPLFQGRPPLPQPDETGKMQVVLNLPASGFKPGNYEVVAVVQQGNGVAEERTQFTIAAN